VEVEAEEPRQGWVAQWWNLSMSRAKLFRGLCHRVRMHENPSIEEPARVCRHGQEGHG